MVPDVRAESVGTTFITGGTSSIGRVLIKELARGGETLRVLVRRTSDRTGLELPGVQLVDGDVTDPETIRRGMDGCARVCHLAAIVGHQVSDSEWWRVNRDGSRNVLQAAYDLGIGSIVQVSSITVLGPTRPGEQADETRSVDTSQYFNLYQKTKRAADDIARQFASQGLPVKIVYPGVGYGCSRASSHPTLTEQTLLRMAAGKPVATLGSGTNKICLAYFKDTAEGIRLAHERGKTGDDYILGGENLTLPEMWAVVAAVLGKRPPRWRIPLWMIRAVSEGSRVLTGTSILPAEVFRMARFGWNFSSAKAERELGWRPHSFRDGTAETWAEYQAGDWHR